MLSFITYGFMSVVVVLHALYPLTNKGDELFKKLS